MSKIDDWNRFTNEILKHIEESGKKYGIEGVSAVDIDPWISCISCSHKYLWEILSWYKQEDWDSEKVKENLLKAAHYCQIAYTKLDE